MISDREIGVFIGVVRAKVAERYADRIVVSPIVAYIDERMMKAIANTGEYRVSYSSNLSDRIVDGHRVTDFMGEEMEIEIDENLKFESRRFDHYTHFGLEARDSLGMDVYNGESDLSFDTNIDFLSIIKNKINWTDSSDSEVVVSLKVFKEITDKLGLNFASEDTIRIPIPVPGGTLANSAFEDGFSEHKNIILSHDSIRYMYSYSIDGVEGYFKGKDPKISDKEQYALDFEEALQSL